jgi:hypothetical protein
MTGVSEERLVLIASAKRVFRYSMVGPPAAKAAPSVHTHAARGPQNGLGPARMTFR